MKMKSQLAGADGSTAYSCRACSTFLRLPIGRLAVAFGQVTLLAISWVMPVSADGIRLWERDVAVATASGDQGLLQPVVVTDGSDGAFVFWHDRQRSKIYLRLLASDGSKSWPSARVVAITGEEKFSPAGVGSGQGDVIVAWAEGRNGAACSASGQADCDIYAQKFDHDGQRLWSNLGRPLVRAAANQGVSGIALAPDGHGGVFAAWQDARPDCCKVYVQHLDQNGRPLWAENGVRISPEPFIVFGPMFGPPVAASDGEGGVLVAWIENQVNPVTESPPLKIQRLDADGNALWTEGGIKVGEPSTVYFSMVPDSAGGALLGFTMSSVNRLHDAAVQKVAPDGTTPWGAQGVRAAVASYYHLAPEVVSDGRGGAFVAWVDNTYTRFMQEDADIRAQRILADGRLVWSDEGRVICDLPGVQDNPRILRASNGGAFLFWRDCRDYLDINDCHVSANLYGQHMRRNGTFAWAGQGAPVSKAAGSQGVGQGTPVRASSIAGTPDQAGGAILAWPDGRVGGCDNAVWTTECDVRAQRVADDPTPSDADLEVNLSVTRAPATGLLTFKIKVSNLGPDTAEGIKLIVPDLENALLASALENGTILYQTLYFTLGNLAIGREHTASFSVTPLSPGEVCANGRVHAETLDSSNANNRGTACIAVP